MYMHGQHCMHADMQIDIYTYYANFMNAVMKRIHAVGVDFTRLPQNVLQALDSLN